MYCAAAVSRQRLSAALLPSAKVRGTSSSSCRRLLSTTSATATGRPSALLRTSSVTTLHQYQQGHRQQGLSPSFSTYSSFDEPHPTLFANKVEPLAGSASPEGEGDTDFQLRKDIRMMGSLLGT